MKKIYDAHGIEITEEDGRYFMGYDAGEIVVQWNKVEITKKELEEIQQLDSSQELYDYMIKNLNSRMHESNTEIIVKAEIEKLLLKFGFVPVVVQLSQTTAYGQKEIYCYKRGELYCCIEFTLHPTVYGEIKEWVLIEYANSLYEAERWIFQDGDMFPLDIPVEEIIGGLEQELMREVKKTR